MEREDQGLLALLGVDESGHSFCDDALCYMLPKQLTLQVSLQT